MRDFQMPGRSPARATTGMAATSHPLATLAAVEMLRDGGNAMDAAVCAAAVQAVVEPQSTGIGGDVFALFCSEGREPVCAFNGSGRAPAAVDIDWYRGQGYTTMPGYGPHSVSVPGAVDAWCRLLADHGRIGLAAALAPAIRYAEEGYVVQDRVAFDWALAAARLAEDEVSAEVFLPGGKAPEAGDLHRQPALGHSLRLIAERGRDGFYKGEVAEDMVARLQALGGHHTLADFAATAGDYCAPISVDYRGYRIHQMPPNTQGLTALLMLNILSGFDLGRLDPLGAERLHLEIEAGRLAYRERDERIADWEACKDSVPALLSPGHAARLCAEIDPDRAMTELPPVALSMSDTVYISVVDEARNAVSFINSTYSSFGSGITCPNSGVVLQNRASSFRLDPAHPNALAPGKRPMHTIMPGMVTRDGRAVMPFGVMGGDYQPFGHVHLLTNMFDFGMDPQAALDVPRVFYQDDSLLAERGVPEHALAALRSRGHEVAVPTKPHGGGQAIWIDWDRGSLTGGSDCRKDGCATGY